MQPAGNALIDTRREPLNGLLGGREHDVVLENVVEVDVPPIATIEDRDGPPAVNLRPELLLRRMLDGMRRAASRS
jgi:hypothetical protein